MEETLVAGVIFFASYHIIKLISEHLLKRKLIKAEQYEKVGILEPPKQTNDEVNRYPSLKWGLVAFMSGLGFVLVEILRTQTNLIPNYNNAALPIGILLVFVSLGFLIYFFIMNRKQNQ